MTENIEPTIRKVDGRTKEARAVKSAARSDEPIHQPIRQARPGRAQVQGRDGQLLTRANITVGDEFEIPDSMIEPGWSYQWCTVSVHGDTDVALNALQELEANGWRAVPASRFPGRFMKTGTPADAAIIRKGQLLMERPAKLTEEARAEEIGKARKQMQDRDQSLMGRKANLRGGMPPGFEMGEKYRGTGGDLRMSIDKGLDIPRPSQPLAEPNE